jgi:hypothetical protein
VTDKPSERDENLERGLIVWVDGGVSTGWFPYGFTSVAKAIEFIESGQAVGRLIVTKRLRLDASKEYHDA